MKKFIFLLCSLGFILPFSASAYPGCPRADIIIGGQVWAACNATTKGNSSADISGWFLSGGKNPVFLSQNGSLSLSVFRKIGNASDALNGPCAPGYTLPTRGDWETIIYSARLNQTSVASLLALPQNSGWIVQKTRNKTTLMARQNIMGSYWSSTIEDIYGNRPIVFHIAGLSGNTRMDTTDGANTESGYSWQRTYTGLELVSSETAEIANVRCIRP